MKMIDCVANRILELCRERNLAVNALARSAGVPPSTVKNILNGARKKPGVVTIKMLCAGQYPWGGSELYSIPEVHRKYRKTHGQKPISVVQ